MKSNMFRKLWGATIIALILVLGGVGYIIQRNFSDVKASILATVIEAQKFMTPSVLKGAEVSLNETQSVNLDMPYNKMDIVKYTVKGGSVTFELVDQNIGAEDSYLAECVNKKDPNEVHEVRYGIPFINVYGLLESNRYVCTFSIERYGMRVAESRPIFVSTGDTPYDKVEILKADSYSDALVLSVKDQYLEDGDKYFAECLGNEGDSAVKGNSQTSQIKIKGLLSETSYDCSSGVLRDGKEVNVGDSYSAKTKMLIAKVFPEENQISFEVSENENRDADLYFAECVDMETEISQKALSEETKLTVSGLSPETKYQCTISAEKGTKIVNSTEVIILKTLESPYGNLEILKFIGDAMFIDLEIKDVENLAAPDFYFAECVDKNDSEKIYTARSKYPQLRVRDLSEKTEYECTVGIQTPKRIAGRSESVTVTTTSLEQSLEQLEKSEQVE